jgi:hypothetical protein
MTFSRITTAGAGTMGSQVAWQMAFHGKRVIMGHSYGGLITQLPIDRGLGAAGVAISSVPPKGILVLPWSIYRALKPAFLRPGTFRGTLLFTIRQWWRVFANTLTESEAREAYDRQAIPASGRAIFQAGTCQPDAERALDGELRQSAPRAAALHRRRKGRDHAGRAQPEELQDTRRLQRQDLLSGISRTQTLHHRRKRMGRGGGICHQLVRSGTVSFATQLRITCEHMNPLKPTGKVALVTDASKGTGAAIAKSLAAEGAAVVVNAINPGMVETEGTQSAGIAASEMRQQVEAQTPLGRIGQPRDIAGAAVFLASPDSSWITGETLVIAGGNR